MKREPLSEALHCVVFVGVWCVLMCIGVVVYDVVCVCVFASVFIFVCGVCLCMFVYVCLCPDYLLYNTGHVHFSNNSASGPNYFTAIFV